MTPEQRQKAQAAVQAWYDDREANNKALFARIDAPPVRIPEPKREQDPLAQAKKERPENWNAIAPFTRPAIDAHGNASEFLFDEKTGEIVVDENGRPVPKEVQYSRKVYATETRSRRVSSGHMPRGKGISWRDNFAGYRYDGNDELVDFAIAYLRRLMMRIDLSFPAVHQTMEMTAAGYKSRQVAKELGIGKGTYQVIYEAGLVLVTLFLEHRPEFIGLHELRTLGHVRLRMPLMTWGDISEEERLPNDATRAKRLDSDL